MSEILGFPVVASDDMPDGVIWMTYFEPMICGGCLKVLTWETMHATANPAFMLHECGALFARRDVEHLKDVTNNTVIALT